MTSLVTRCQYEVSTRLSDYPLFDRLRARSAAKRVTSQTDIVIEGFPRSANSFSVAAFQLAQPTPVEIADHLHLPLQIREGVRLNKPVIALVRTPIDAVVSLHIREPYISLRQGLLAYRVFYRSIAQLSDRFVIATFEEVTSDFGQVIERVNQRFGSNFTPFDHTSENVEQVWQKIEAGQAVRKWSAQEVERKATYPVEGRKSIAAELKDELQSSRYQSAVRETQQIYEQFLELRSSQ